MERNVFRVGPIRPPSEANSLLIQITRGCTWNKCKFCTIYRDTSFKAYSADSVKEDIDAIVRIAEQVQRYRYDGGWDIDGLNMRLGSTDDDEERQCFYMVANWLIGGGENVFLQDGNSTALSSGRLSDVLIYLKEAFPQIRRITSYGRAENLARNDASYYAELKAAGLDRIHSGFESGSDEVLALVNKGTTSEQQIQAGRNVRAGGIELSIYFMPGIGGQRLSRENAIGTAHVINETNPNFVRVRTAAIKPGTDLYQDFVSGYFSICSDDDKVGEIQALIQHTKGVSSRIVSDHMVNLLQDIEGSMCSREAGSPDNSNAGNTEGDRAQMLHRIDQYFSLPEVDRRVFQLLRRSLRAYNLDDLKKLTPAQLDQLRSTVLKKSPDEWSEEMNSYICRYI